MKKVSTAKKKRRKNIGKMTGSREMWAINPVTRIKQSKKRKNDRKRVKEKLKSGDYDV